MGRLPVVVLCAGLVVAGHVTLGWLAVVPASLLAGAADRHHAGWQAGLSTALLGWGALLVWSLAVATGPTLELARIVGGLAGAPSALVFILTLLVAGALGASSGWLGAGVRNILR